MYGWRGRIGVIIPADNAVMEPDFHRLAPEGVSAHAARLQKCPRPEMPIAALELVKTFLETHVDIIAYMCAASSFVMGPKGNEKLCKKLSEITGGLPALTATTAMIEGFEAVGAKRIAVIAPHPPEIVKKLSQYIGKTSSELQANLGKADEDFLNEKGNFEPVSYTHLTLPTSDLV